MSSNEMGDITVIECEITRKRSIASDNNSYRFTKIVADTRKSDPEKDDPLVIGLLERAKIQGPRVVFCPPTLRDRLMRSSLVVDAGRKYSTDALWEKFVKKEKPSVVMDRDVAFLQDARFEEIPEQQKRRKIEQGESAKAGKKVYWGIIDAAGVTKGINSLCEAQAKLVRRPYFVVIDQERFDELMSKVEGRVLLHSQMPQLMSQYLGDSPLICEIRDQILEAARDPRCTVLILGESGTGKSQIAQLIHEYTIYGETEEGKEGTPHPGDSYEYRVCWDMSPKKQSPGKAKTIRSFVMVDCGAIPEDIFEGEMFGKKKGAATDVKQDTKGKFEQANGGTLFLDEVGNIDKKHQPKFLAVLRTKKVSPIGHSGEPITLDQRVICATNADLEEDLRQGKLREDLYYRLNESDFTIRIPPLREHPEDIPLIAGSLWKSFVETSVNKKQGQASSVPLNLPSGVLDELKKLKWPGNVSQLQGVIKKLYKEATRETKQTLLELLLNILSKEHIPLSDRMIMGHTTALIEQVSEELETLLRVIPARLPRDGSELGEPLNRALLQAFDHVKSLRNISCIKERDHLFRKLRSVQNDLEDAIRFMEAGNNVHAMEWPSSLKQNLTETVPHLIEEGRILKSDSGKRDLRGDVAIGTDLLALREILAKVNHDIWMDMRLSEGWVYGSRRNDELKPHPTHPDLVHYDALSEREKQYDRNMAIGTIRALHHLGYRITKDMGEKKKA